MKLSKILLILAFAKTFTCSAEPHIIDTNKQAFKDTAVILINHVSSNKIIPIYYNNIFETLSFPIYINNNHKWGSETKIITKETMFLNTFADENYYLVKPGEVIDVAIDSLNKPIFIDRKDSIRTNELAFFKELSQHVKWPPFKKIKINTVEDFNKLNKMYISWYNNAIEYLRIYNREKEISDSFAILAKRFIYYQYIEALLNANFVTYSNKEILSKTFLKRFPICDSCALYPPYEGALFGYIKAISENQTPLIQFVSSYEAANINLSGISKKRVLFRLLNINQHILMGESQFRECLNSFFIKYKNDTLANFLEDNYSKKLLALKSIEKGGLNELLLGKDGQMLSLQSILKKNKGKLILIDFWASYCIPCLSEIPYSLDLQKRYPNLCIIYISLDIASKNWITSLNKTGLQNVPNNYLMFNIGKSTIREYFGIKNIPRYVMYGKDGMIISKNAPPPRDAKLINLIEDHL